LLLLSTIRPLLNIVNRGARFVDNHKAISSVSIISILLPKVLLTFWWLLLYHGVDQRRLLHFLLYCLCSNSLIGKCFFFHLLRWGLIIIFTSLRRITCLFFFFIRSIVVIRYLFTAAPLTLDIVVCARKSDAPTSLPQQGRGLVQEEGQRLYRWLLLSFLITFFHQYFISKKN